MIKVGVDSHTDDRENFQSPLLLRLLIVMVSTAQRFCGLLTGPYKPLCMIYFLCISYIFLCSWNLYIIKKTSQTAAILKDNIAGT